MLFRSIESSFVVSIKNVSLNVLKMLQERFGISLENFEILLESLRKLQVSKANAS